MFYVYPVSKTVTRKHLNVIYIYIYIDLQSKSIDWFLYDDKSGV